MFSNFRFYCINCHLSFIFHFIDPKFLTYHRVLTRITRRVSLVEQELLTLPEHPSSPPFFIGVRVTRSVVFCVVFVISLFVLLSLFFWPLHCMSFFDVRFLMTCWYLQTLLSISLFFIFVLP